MILTVQQIRDKLSKAAKLKGRVLIQCNPHLKTLIERLDLRVDFEAEFNQSIKTKK